MGVIGVHMPTMSPALLVRLGLWVFNVGCNKETDQMFSLTSLSLLKSVVCSILYANPPVKCLGLVLFPHFA